MSLAPPAYRHVTKAITPATPITLGECALKWYEIAPADEPVPPDLRVLARQPARGNGTHRPTFCVWELGAVWHEQQAWSRFLLSERGVAERAAYLRDTVTGEV